MEKAKNSVVVNHLKLIIIALLLFLAFQQAQILDEADSCQCWSQIDEIQDDINEIKDRLGI
ncbi:hypothetical protein [Spirosoma sordidisoli]|uniref:Uncharacterized protein n=1 Tax=Spirosoma sordidisoli TaxID=2502893 RepID=A0A4Q2UUM0_9BACT|nr:hypothetical protein [Spirosoma sordidisoli]RYC71661.1 hypothetical protein EQG79_05885 [Spirosoma sordidisoli]